MFAASAAAVANATSVTLLAQRPSDVSVKLMPDKAGRCADVTQRGPAQSMHWRMCMYCEIMGNSAASRCDATCKHCNEHSDITHRLDDRRSHTRRMGVADSWGWEKGKCALRN